MYAEDYKLSLFLSLSIKPPYFVEDGAKTAASCVGCSVACISPEHVWCMYCVLMGLVRKPSL